MWEICRCFHIISHFRSLREENSFGIPAHWINQRINPVFKLLLADQIMVNNGKPVELELSIIYHILMGIKTLYTLDEIFNR